MILWKGHVCVRYSYSLHCYMPLRFQVRVEVICFCQPGELGHAFLLSGQIEFYNHVSSSTLFFYSTFVSP